MTRVILRAIGYALLLLLSLVASHKWFGDSDTALLSLFTLGSFVGEMLLTTGGRRQVAMNTMMDLDGHTSRPKDGTLSQYGIFFGLSNRQTYARALAYVFALIGLAFFGGVMLHNAMKVREANRSQEYMERRLTGAFNGSEKTIALATNDHDTTVAISGGLLRKIGYTRAEVLNKPVTNIIPEFDIKQAKADVLSLREVAHAGWLVRETRPMRFKTKDGKILSIDMTIIACRIASDRIMDRDVLFLMLAEEQQ